MAPEHEKTEAVDKKTIKRIKEEKNNGCCLRCFLSGPLCVGLAAFGSGVGTFPLSGYLWEQCLAGFGRQPEASGKILTSMIIGAAFIEAFDDLCSDCILHSLRKNGLR